MKTSSPLPFRFLIVAFFAACFAQKTEAQPSAFDLAAGLPSITTFTVSIVTGSLNTIHYDVKNGTNCVVTVNGIYQLVKPENGQAYASSLWTAPVGVEIQGVWAKLAFDGPEELYYVLTSDKHWHIVSLTATVDAKTGERDCSMTGDKDYGTGSEKFNGDIAYTRGDDTYVVTTAGSIFVTHDDSTWQVDTAGFNGAFVSALEVDTEQNVYAAIANGIYKQPLNGTQWSLLSGSPKSVTNFFRTLTNQMFAATYGALWVTGDNGATWNLDTAGMGFTQVKSICDDGNGNYYAVSSSYQYGDHLWKQTSGSAWVAIDAALAGISANPSIPYLKAVAVDSGIHVATNFGTFHSYDGGASWQLLKKGMAARNVYAYYKFPNGRQLATTDLGLFTKDPSDTTWQKQFPENSYLAGVKYSVDNFGTMYVYGASRMNGYQTLPPDLYVSTDRGSNWVPDTAGLSQFSGGTEFIDENGTIHLATSNGQTLSLYAKGPGGLWKGDSAGYSSNAGDAVSAFASDRHGFIYLAINNSKGGRLIKRPITGGSWSEVSTSALGGVPYAFTTTKDGMLVGGNSNISMGYYDGTSWTVIPPPSGLSNPSGYPESVDSSNRLWVIYGSIDQNYYYTAFGTYWTSDMGQHWTQAADGSYNFASLVSFGDTTYGLNSGLGLIGMSPALASVASAPQVTQQFSIVPNPAINRVEFDVDAINSTIEIYNVNGEKIFTLRGEDKIVWDLQASGFRSLPNGTYLAKASGRSPSGMLFTDSKHFVIDR